MTKLEIVIQEAERLIKPSLLLRTKRSGEPIGMWRGDPLIDDPPYGEHLISVNCDWLMKEGCTVPKSITLYLHAPSSRKPQCTLLLHDQPFDAFVESGDKLFGYEAPSWPPLDALDRFANDEVIQAIAPAPPPSLRAEYQDWWTERSPQYDHTIAAVLGGWHERWPEDYDADVYGRPNATLALWTLWEADLWVEVWVSDAGKIEAIVRTIPEDE